LNARIFPLGQQVSSAASPRRGSRQNDMFGSVLPGACQAILRVAACSPEGQSSRMQTDLSQPKKSVSWLDVDSARAIVEQAVD
jgi:hypothetical protein